MKILCKLLNQGISPKYGSKYSLYSHRLPTECTTKERALEIGQKVR